MPLYLINFLENMTALLGSDSDTTVVEPVVKNVFGTYRAGCLKSIAKAESKCSDVLNLNRGVSFPVYNPDLGPDAADRTYCGIADAMALKLFATEARDAKQLCQEASENDWSSNRVLCGIHKGGELSQGGVGNHDHQDDHQGASVQSCYRNKKESVGQLHAAGTG